MTVDDFTTTDKSKDHDIAIVGYSLRAPNCRSVPEFAAALKSGQDLTTGDTRYPHGHLNLPPRQGRLHEDDISSFDASFFGLSHKQAEAMDPLIRMLLQVSYEALLDAQIPLEQARGSATGVYVGHCFSDVGNMKTSCWNQDKNGYELVNGANSMAANRLSFFYDFQGPSLVIDTACSSSLVALDCAVRDLEQGTIDRAIVAGLSLTLNPHKNACFNAFTMLSPTGHCHVFDSKADGYCRSDGVACIVLERRKPNCLTASPAYALVAGTGTNSDGSKNEGITYPSWNQQALLMEQVYARIDTVHPDEISYHEAHGTGTIAGDRVEIQALSKVYKQQLIVGSVKSNMGHAEGASGLMGLIKMLLMYEDEMIYPNHGFEDSPHEPIQNGQFQVLKEAVDWMPAPCSISSFGFGGSNAFCILRPAPKGVNSSNSPATSLTIHNRIPRPFASSDQSPSPSEKHQDYYQLQQMLGNHTQFPFVWSNGKWQEHSPLVFVLDGQGSQWNNMGQDLMQSSTVFRETMHRLGQESGVPLVDLYQDGSKWMMKEYSTLGIVSFQLGLIAVLRQAGIEPDLFLGHSVGELACSYLAGCATEAQVIQFAMVRTVLVNSHMNQERIDVYDAPPADGFDYEFTARQEEHHDDSSSSLSLQRFAKCVKISTPRNAEAIESFSMQGLMAVVGAAKEDVHEAIRTLELSQTRIACYNAPKGQTISGPAAEVRSLIAFLKEKDASLFVRELSTDGIAYHSKLLQIFSGQLINDYKIDGVRPLPSAWKSTSRGTEFSKQYLVENVCGPVFFQEAIEALPANATIVEIGPSSGLLSQIKRTKPDLKLHGLVDHGKGANLTEKLEDLEPWVLKTEPHDATPTSAVSEKSLHYHQRYPRVWSNNKSFDVLTWNDFELPQGKSNPTVVYDLNKKPFSSLRHHVIRGKNLFPATGFVHALWSAASFETGTEIFDFRIKTPLVISSTATSVVLQLRQAGEYCELRDESGNVVHASAKLRKVPKTSSRPVIDLEKSDAVEGEKYYPDRRRLGYEYGPDYQLLGEITPTSAKLRSSPLDWISYMDSMLHLAIFDATAFAYPVGFDRVVFWDNNLDNASCQVSRIQGMTIGNETVLLEGLRLEYQPAVTKSPSVWNEEFVPYAEVEDALPAKTVAALLLRESTSFRVQEPLESNDLKTIVEELESIPITNCHDDKSPVLVSDATSDLQDADLIVTTDESIPSPDFHVVARYAQVRIYRRNKSEEIPVVNSWETAKEMNGTFVWNSVGASGGGASLLAETRGAVQPMSYDCPIGIELIGLQKQMKQNFLLEDGSHGVWVDSPLTLTAGATQPSTDAALLRTTEPGNLQSLEWTSIDKSSYSVAVHVAALNFRDIMRAMGRLKEADLSLGLEFSGSEVSGGRRVFGIGKPSIGTHCNPMYSFPTPAHISDEEAATIPVVYLTVYFALFHKAQMKKGQSVLIHAGSGGVGLAAITVAQKRGLEVFTTCSASKREFLKAKFGLDDAHIGDSRSDTFVKTVHDGTQGRGVDVVLNSLSGHLQVASLRCVAPQGHFCEIGKYDVMQNSGIGQGLLAANVSFHVIDLLPLVDLPEYKPFWDNWLAEGFEAKEIEPLPHIEFESNDVIDAFRFMSQGKHQGKVLITGLQNREYHVKSQSASVKGERHLITGGLGGLGLHLAESLAKNGCGEIILVGRSGVTTGYQRWQIEQLESHGCAVKVVKSDLLELNETHGAPDRIWHAATVYEDILLSEMTAEAWDLVNRTKVTGYFHLRKTWPSTPIVAISSVASYFGNALQTSYATANASLDAAARLDENTISVRLGPVDNVGFITKGKNNRLLLERVPFELMAIDAVLEQLMDIARFQNNGVFGIYDLKQKQGQQGSSGGATAQGKSASYELQDAQKFIAMVLGGAPEQYTPTMKLKAAGLDSLSTMELVHHIQDMSGDKSFAPSDISEDFSIQGIVETVNKRRASSGFKFVPTTKVEDSLPEVSGEELTQGQPALVEKVEVVKMAPVSEERVASRTLHVVPGATDFQEIISCLDTADVLVLRQSDPNIFNHGAPIDSTNPDAVPRFIDKYVELAQAFEKSDTTVVVMIEGEVRGGGMLFPAMADISLATSKASFGLPEIHRGMVPGVVSRSLEERLGRATVRRLSLTGERFDAETAAKMGLVDTIVGESDVDHHIQGLLRRWEKNGSATRFIKSTLLPKNKNSASAMGTVVGSWLQSQSSQRVVSDRHVLDVELSPNGVAVLTMCDEMYHNTLTFEMTAAIRAQIPQLRQEARAIVLASSLRNFHVGMNPSRAREWAGRPASSVAADMKESYMGFVELATLGIPIVAVLNGRVYGGGLPIALWADYRICVTDVDMHFGNLSRGMSPAGQLSRLLREYLSPSDIMQTYLENSHWNSDDLLRLRIASHVASTKHEALSEAKKLAGFIASNPSHAVVDTLKMVKMSYAADVADEEAWMIAKKITDASTFNSSNSGASFRHAKSSVIRQPQSLEISTPQQTVAAPPAVGIIAFEVYTPSHAINAETLEQHGIPAKTKQGQDAVAVWDASEDSISMALNAVDCLLKKHVVDPYQIGRVEVGTESNVDMAKSIKSYLMQLLPSDHVDVEGVDNINACYGGTAALLNTLAYCRETGKLGIVVATDTADMDLPQSGWRGASAVAMLVGVDPWIEIHPERASCFKHTNDFLKPRYREEHTPVIQTKASMDHYMFALDSCIDQMQTNHSIDAASLDAFIFHGGLCATFMKLVERHLLVKMAKGNQSWKENFPLARQAAGLMGGLYTASMYVNLVSFLENAQSKNLGGGHIGLFSYGSGSTATLLHATIHTHKSRDVGLSKKLKARSIVTYETLCSILKTDQSEFLQKTAGTFYRDLSVDGVERNYKCQGGSLVEDQPIATSGIALSNAPPAQFIPSTASAGSISSSSKQSQDESNSQPSFVLVEELEGTNAASVSSRDTMERGVLATKARYPTMDPARKQGLPLENFIVSEFADYKESRAMVEEILSNGLRVPYFMEHEGVIAGTTKIDGKECVDFTAYNYLGLAGDSNVCSAAELAIQQYGTSCSTSRFSGERKLHRTLEVELSDFLNCEDCLVFSAGFLAIASAISTLAKDSKDLILYDRFSHRSAIDGIQSSPATSRMFPHNDYQYIDNFLKNHRHEYRRVVIAIEGAYSMDGDLPDLPKFVELREKHKVFLMVDEAHSLGCTGRTGRGIREHYGIAAHQVDIWAGTLSKSLASCGGYVAGGREMIEYFKINAPGFVYSAGISPANTAAALAALRQLQREPERVQSLQARTKQFVRLAKARGLDIMDAEGDCAVVPVIIGDFKLALKAASVLLENGVHVLPVGTPAVPKGSERLRFFLSSQHTEAQIALTVNTCAKILQMMRQHGK
eukprot:CAMPEP_0172448792 /NCGR_PEP_ID=MMETSP1065-20121228/7729_1 /TAXON_ID=265537 /ORGANISM="Amphiprora paludosa, Strain CCMP125" /LENGTH=3370 /DNA_ID=CAMNT_0013200381 /DNA_START=215 /DNA_END=10327 /DNA_ORIENTATION=+